MPQLLTCCACRELDWDIHMRYIKPDGWNCTQCIIDMTVIWCGECRTWFDEDTATGCILCHALWCDDCDGHDCAGGIIF